MCTTLPHLTDDHERLWDDLSAALRSRGRASLTAHYRFIFEWLADRFAKKVWIERSGLSLLFVPTLAKMFPDARFVHLYRDGRDTAISMSRHPYFRLRVQSEELMMKFGIDPYRPFNLLGTSPYIPFLEWLRFQFFTAERYRRTEIALPAFGGFGAALIRTRGCVSKRAAARARAVDALRNRAVFARARIAPVHSALSGRNTKTANG